LPIEGSVCNVFEKTVAINGEHSGDGKGFDLNLAATSKVEKKVNVTAGRDFDVGESRKRNGCPGCCKVLLTQRSFFGETLQLFLIFIQERQLMLLLM